MVRARWVGVLLVVAGCLVLAGLLVAVAGDVVAPLPTVTPSTYGPPPAR